MTAARTLLVELFVEELPPKALDALGHAFAKSIFDGLIRYRLRDRVPGMTELATPRRLGVVITDVFERSVEEIEEVKVMPSSVGLDASGVPTSALLKRLSALGEGPQAVARLERRMDGKSEALYLSRAAPGHTLAAGLQAILEETIKTLPIPKLMR
jgi:glycyl-tRNA synthetase beta chain